MHTHALPSAHRGAPSHNGAHLSRIPSPSPRHPFAANLTHARTPPAQPPWRQPRAPPPASPQVRSHRCSALRDGEVESLDGGQSLQEELAGETNTMVTDVMDVDRTPELLVWLFSGLFGGGNKDGGEAGGAPQPAAVSSSSNSSGASSNGSGSEAAALSAAPEASSSAASAAAAQPAAATEVATLGGGCFWCIEACFLELQGVLRATSGYSGGQVPNPTYKQIGTGRTGHAEVVRVEYDPSVLSYRDVLQVFFSIHDPTTPNRQGNDKGPQYRSVIMYHSEQQRRIAEEVMAEAGRDRWFSRGVVTQLVEAPQFYPAEAYHQRYYVRNPTAPYCAFVVSPKLASFRQKYAKNLKSAAAQQPEGAEAL